MKKILPCLCLIFFIGLLSPKNVLADSYTLSGSVTAGQAIVGATVDVYSSGTTNDVVPPATTDQSGDYSFSNLPSGSYDIKVTPPSGSGYSSTIAYNQTISGNKILNFILTSANALTFSGQIQDANGTPVPDQQVQLTSSSGNQSGATTDSAGDFTISGLAAGTYRIYFTVDHTNTDPSYQIPGWYKIEVDNYSLTQSVSNLDVKIPAVQTTMHVQDQPGNPIGGVGINGYTNENVDLGNGLAGQGLSVTASNSNGPFPQTDPTTGDVAIWLFPGTGSFTAIPPSGYAPATVGATISSGTVVPITLQTQLTFSGQIQDANGTPVPDQQVQLTSSSGNQSGATTDSAGDFTISGLAAGTYRIYFTVDHTNTDPSYQIPGWYKIEVDNYSLTQSVSNLDVKIPAVQTTMHVQDQPGNPIGGVGINGYTNENVDLGNGLAGQGLSVTASNSNGPFPQTDPTTGDVAIWLFPGTGSFTAIPPSGSIYSTFILNNINITGNQTEIISLQSVIPTPTPPPTYGLSGIVYNDNNQNGVQDSGENGYADATVTLNTGQSTTTDSNGNYSFSNIESGTYVETLTVPDGYLATTTNPVNVPLAANTTVNFGIAAATPTDTPTPTGPVTLTPTSDSYLNVYEQNQNEGGAPVLRIEQSLKSRTLVKFDESQIAAAVGNDHNYTATLEFTITDNGNNWGTGKQIELDRLFQDWSEGNGYVNGNPNPYHGTGSGVTWNCAADSNISNNTKDCTTANTWDMDDPGSYPFASPTATTIIANHESGTISFDVTSDIQSFLNGTNQNYGWILKRTDESTTGKVDFGSKESGNGPVLIIQKN